MKSSLLFALLFVSVTSMAQESKKLLVECTESDGAKFVETVDFVKTAKGRTEGYIRAQDGGSVAKLQFESSGRCTVTPQVEYQHQ